MYNRLKYLFDKQNLFFKSQYGFREKYYNMQYYRYCNYQVHSNMSRKWFTCGIFIDLQKAFDSVYYSVLLKKLHHSSESGVLCFLLICLMKKSVPQGFVLGTTVLYFFVPSYRRSV